MEMLSPQGTQQTAEDVGDPGGGSQNPLPVPSVSGEVRLVFVQRGAGFDVCGGRIGVDQVKFCAAECAEGATHCGKVAHATKKAELQSGGLYIGGSKKGGTAFLQPVLATSSEWPPSVTSALEGTRTTQEWVEVFAALEGITGLLPSEQIDILARLGRKVDAGPTPMRIRKRLLYTEGEQEEEASVDEANDALDAATLPEGDYNMTDSTEHVIRHWNTVVRATRKQRTNGVELETSVRGLLEEVDDKVLKVASMVGQTRPSNAPAVTVWASIGAHEEVLGNYTDNLATWLAVKRELETKIAGVVGELKTTQGVVTGQVQPVVQTLVQMVTNLQAQAPGTGVQGGSGSRVEEQEADSRAKAERKQLAARQVSLANQVRALIERSERQEAALAKLTANQAAPHPRGSSGGGIQHPAPGGQGATAIEMQELREMVGHLQDEVAGLQTDNTRLRAAMDSDVLTFGGFSFPTDEAVELFVVANVPGNYYGFCYDIVSLLECYRDRNRTTQEGLSHKHIIGRAGFKDGGSARIATSFGTVIPEVFGCEEDPIDPAKKLGDLKTAETWDHPSTRAGKKVVIGLFLTNHRKTVDGQIVKTFGPSSTATLFFQHMLQQTLKFWDAYTAWVTSFERELSQQSGCDDLAAQKASVWNLICWMTHAMFTEMSVRRAAGASADAIEDQPTTKCATILQATLSAHKFMTELVAADFMRHPIFAATMDEYLLKTKASMAAVLALQAKVKKLEAGVTSAQSLADKAMQAAGKKK